MWHWGCSCLRILSFKLDLANSLATHSTPVSAQHKPCALLLIFFIWMPIFHTFRESKSPVRSSVKSKKINKYNIIKIQMNYGASLPPGAIIWGVTIQHHTTLCVLYHPPLLSQEVLWLCCIGFLKGHRQLLQVCFYDFYKTYACFKREVKWTRGILDKWPQSLSSGGQSCVSCNKNAELLVDF